MTAGGMCSSARSLTLPAPVPRGYRDHPGHGRREARRESFSLGFDCSHLVRMVVVVGERPVDISDIEVVVGSNLFRRLASIDHPLSDVMNANSSPVDPWRTTEDIIGCDDFTHYLPIHGSG